MSGASAASPRRSAARNGVARVRSTAVTEVREARDSHDATVDRRGASGDGPIEPDNPDAERPPESAAVEDAPSVDRANPALPAWSAEPDFGRRLEARRAYEAGLKVAAAAKRASNSRTGS